MLAEVRRFVSIAIILVHNKNVAPFFLFLQQYFTLNPFRGTFARSFLSLFREFFYENETKKDNAIKNFFILYANNIPLSEQTKNCFSPENAYNAVQDLLSVYGLAMSSNDIVEAFNKRNEAAASMHDLANNREYFITFH